VQLTKHQALGNDFLVALERDQPGLEPSAELARRWCHRHLGIGADGMIFGLPHPTATVEMVLYNADGSSAEISGNGIRCLVNALDTGESDHVLVATPGGVREVRIEARPNPGEIWATVDMGEVTDLGAPADLGIPHGRVLLASIGNPHLVVEVLNLDSVDLTSVGPLLEPILPGGVNVHFLMTDGTDAIRLVHWERGVGPTLACGSGASVAAVAAHRWGLAGARVEVHMPGGTARVRVLDDTPPRVELTGPAIHIAEVVVR
jgi:diaminopimelate epimerase